MLAFLFLQTNALPDANQQCQSTEDRSKTAIIILKSGLKQMGFERLLEGIQDLR